MIENQNNQNEQFYQNNQPNPGYQDPNMIPATPEPITEPQITVPPAVETTPQEPVVGISLEQATEDTSAVTFDYNQLYNAAPTTTTEQVSEQESTWGLEETPISFDDVEQQVAPRDVVTDVIPAFDANALEELPDDLKHSNPDEPLIHSMAKETQQEKDQHRRNLIFIAIFFAVLIFAVVVIFPILVNSGLK